MTESPADASGDQLQPLVDAILERFGERVDAIILYGSWRRGRRDTMPDFYVLLARYPSGAHYWPGRLLPPTVGVMRAGELRAKVTVLSTDQLVDAVARDFHPYFWARFAQPALLLHARSDVLRRTCESLCANAAERLVKTVAGCWTAAERPGPAAFWQYAFRLTYGAELRSETPERIASLYAADASWYDALYSHHAHATGMPDASPGRARAVWRLRQIAGKFFSAVRIIKSALTFEDPLGYLAWKVGRQSGVRLDPSPRARRWPLLFGWGYVWRLYRAGGFK